MPRSPKAKAKHKSGSTVQPAKKPVAPKDVNRPDVAKDALALLEADHRAVKQLFTEFESASGDAEKRRLSNAICVALKVHARLEEDLFYPAALAAIRSPAVIQQAQVEHASARDLIAQIEAGAPGEVLFDARVKVLGEYIDHHVAEEEDEIFPQCRASGIDLVALGARLALRKNELSVGFVVSNPVLALSPATT